MKRITKLFLVLALLVSSVTFTSCEVDFYDDSSLVDEAIYNFNRSGLRHDYYTAYNWLLTYYPDLYDYEFDVFMSAVLNGSPTDFYWDDYNNSRYYWNSYYDSERTSEDNTLVAEAQTLMGAWSGSLIYEYTDDNTKMRVRDEFTADMKFFQYNSSARSLSGNGVEVDTDAEGNQQVLDFYWYIDKDGSIYIKYKRTGTTFILDASRNRFHLGYENGKLVDTFFGEAYSSNTTDYMAFDLERVSSRSSIRNANKMSFGGATKNTFSEKRINAKSRLHLR